MPKAKTNTTDNGTAALVQQELLLALKEIVRIGDNLVTGVPLKNRIADMQAVARRAIEKARQPHKKLVVKVERRFDGSLHTSLLVTLEDAAKTGSLDAALAHLVAADLSPDWWIVGRSGYHVWLSQVRDGRTDRVAMIAEVE